MSNTLITENKMNIEQKTLTEKILPQASPILKNLEETMNCLQRIVATCINETGEVPEGLLDAYFKAKDAYFNRLKQEYKTTNSV